MSNKPQTTLVVPLCIIGALFFIFGFVTWLNGALVPFLKTILELSNFEAMLVLSSFYIAYTVMAFPMASIIEKTGYKKGMAIGLLLIAAGAILFIPAAYSREFYIFIIAQFIVGSGLTILQTASNPYVIKLGPSESAAVRICIMGLLNKAAGVVAPIVFTALVLSGITNPTDAELSALDAASRNDTLNALAGQLVTPYIGMAIALIVLATGLMFAPLPELTDEVPEGETTASFPGLLKFPQLILGATALFFYVGVEVIAGDAIGLLGQQANIADASQLTSYTMIFMVLGYIVGVVAIPKYISQQTALLGSAILGMIFTFFVMTSSISMQDTGVSAATLGLFGVPEVPNAIMFVALLGFANALVWPAIWPLALDGLGKFTSKGAALLIMGIAGGAVFPPIFGHFADSGDGQAAFWVLIPGYAFILFYALIGHKMRSWGKKSDEATGKLAAE